MRSVRATRFNRIRSPFKLEICLVPVAMGMEGMLDWYMLSLKDFLYTAGTF